MRGLIHIAEGDYPKYETLLLRRDQLKKEGLMIRRAYIKEFGELINRKFEKMVACIELKKKIAFCAAIVNRGEQPDEDELNAYIDRQMSDYRVQLADMIEELNSTKEDSVISPADVREIKGIYRKIARSLHPDLSTVTTDHPELSQLWDRACIAYKCNDLKSIQEVEFLVERALDQLGEDVQCSVIPNIEEKISELEKEIEEIINTEPYAFKLILEDPSEKEEKKAVLEAEYNQYCSYEALLKQQLEILMGEGE